MHVAIMGLGPAGLYSAVALAPKAEMAGVRAALLDVGPCRSPQLGCGRSRLGFAAAAPPSVAPGG